MDLTSLLAFFADQALSVRHRALSIVYSEPASELLAPVLLPQRAHVREGICADVEVRLTCLTTHVHLDVSAFVGVYLALAWVTDQGTRRLLPMVIDNAWRGRSNGGLTAVHLTGRDPLAMMDVPHYRVFRERSALAVVCDVLDGWITTTPLGAAFDYSLAGIATDRHPKRANIIQFADETDADFFRRLLRAEGIAWFWRPQADAGGGRAAHLPKFELVLFDDPSVLLPAATPTVRYHRRDGTETADAIDLLNETWQLVPAAITLASWDHEQARVDVGVGTADIPYGAAGRELANALAHSRVVGPHLGDDFGDLARLAQARADHDSFQAHGFRGRCGDRTMTPGTWKIVEGYGPFESRPADDRKLIVTQAESFTENNLPAELHGPAQALMGDFGVPEWARVDVGPRTSADARRGDAAGDNRGTQPFTCLFSAVPIASPIRPPPPDARTAGRQPVLTGVVVVEHGNGELDGDELGRVGVRLVGAQPGADTVSCQRPLMPWAGRDHGMVAVPRAGSEVALCVLGFDRLLIIGSAFNGANPPARPAHRPSLPANQSQMAIVSRELGGSRQQHLLFDDFPGQLTTQLASDAGATALALGELTTPRSQGKAQPRGNGFELRSDDSGALRTAKSLLLTAWGRLNAGGHQLSAEEHTALMQDCLNLFRALGGYAAEHHGLALDDAPQAELLAATKAASAGSNVDPEGRGGAPTISLSAPAGVATTTPKTIVSYAGGNIDSVAQQHLNLTAGQQFNLNAGQGVGLFAHHNGLRAIAHHGPLLLQAQHDSVQVDAATDLRFTAGGGKLVAMAQEIHLIAADGSFVKIGGGGITLGTDGPITEKAAGFVHQGPATMGTAFPSFGAGPADQRFVLRSVGLDGPVAANRRYTVTLTDGSSVSGESDAQGRTDILQRDAMHIAGVRIEESGA